MEMNQSLANNPLPITLIEKQKLFVKLIGELIEFAYDKGFELTFGEALRTQTQALANAAAGSGIKNSLHLIRLAVDFNLFKNGMYLSKTEDHRPLGEYWETLNPLCRWGGNFNDGNHYSMEHDGVK